ncbi:MAG TPA: cellulase family glycosylhydrolase [Anaerolineales bacterium]|nr:cellulase family glycosylhydrolase [Anaerolineales bacterium]
MQVDELDLTVEGSPFRFVGANAIYFGFYEEYGLSIEEAIQSAKENGISVLRIYIGFGRDPWGGRPYEEYDKALDIAAQNGMYVIATLTDCCCMGGDWGQTSDTYYSHVPFCDMANATGLASYKEYIKSVLLRRNTVNGKIYRDDTTILAWDVANEPALQIVTDVDLHAWLLEVTSYIKTLDAKHLVTIGIDASRSLYDSGGPHYEALNVPGLDFFSFHHNLPNYSKVPQQLDQIAFRTRQFTAMGKPVVLEEFGIGSQRVLGQNAKKSTLESWVLAYKDQMDMAFAAGASGVMFWGWGVPETRTVPLWWKLEDHDITETEFCALIREYQIPTFAQP